MESHCESKEGLVQRLRPRIDPYLGSICNKLNLSVPHETTAGDLEFEKKIEYALRQLKNKGYNSHEARRRLVTAITDVVGWEWKEDISELLGESGGKSSNNYDALKMVQPKRQTYAYSHGSATRDKELKDSPAQLRCFKLTTCKVVCSLLILSSLLLVSAIALTIVFAAKNHSYSKEKWVQEGDTIMLAKVESFWYEEITIQETVDYYDSDYSIDAFILPCDYLKKHSVEIVFQSRGLYLHEETFLFGEQPGNTPIYLLAGSQIMYSFEIATNKALSIKPEFFVFDDYNAFQSFIRGQMSGVTSAIYHQILTVGTPQNPALTEVKYTVIKDGYYFVTGFSEAGITYQFNMTDSVRYLNLSDYTGKYSSCHISSGFSCPLTTNKDIFGTYNEYCLIAHINRPYPEDPPSTRIVVHINKRYDLLLIPGIVAAVSGVMLVMIVLVGVAILAKRRKRRGYSAIQ